MVHACFSGIWLALNADKSDCILFSTTQEVRTFQPLNSINVADSSITLSPNIKTLVAQRDSRINLQGHVQSIIKSCYYNIKAIRHIKPLAGTDTAKTVACSSATSRLDNANFILYGTSMGNLDQLQWVQNTLARVVAGPAVTSCNSVQRSLHWLLIHHRTRFKNATL